MKLVALYLGGRAEKATIEVHDVVFIITENWRNDKEKIRQLWFGRPDKVHIDAVAEIEKIDGYKIDLRNESNCSQNQLWFVNFGAAIPGAFSEYHENGFVVASSKREAIEKAKKKFCLNLSGRHCDTMLELEECISVSEVMQGVINLTPDSGENVINIENCYISI